MSEHELLEGLAELVAKSDLPQGSRISISSCGKRSDVTLFAWMGSSYKYGTGKTIAEALSNWEAQRDPTPAEKLAKLRAEADALEASINAATK